MRAFRYEDTSIYPMDICPYIVLIIYTCIYLYMYICAYIDIISLSKAAYNFASAAFKSYISPAPIISTELTSFA